MFEHNDYNNYGNYGGLVPFQGFQSPFQDYQYQQEQPQPDRDDRDEMLEAVTRFAALFTLGVLVTLFARSFPALRPFYWIGVAGVFMALGLGSYLGRNVKLISLTVAVAISIVAGHWDFLNYQGHQVYNNGQQAIQKVQEHLP